MSEIVVRTISTVVMAAVVVAAVYYRRNGLHSLLAVSQFFIAIELSNVPSAKQNFRFLSLLSDACAVAYVYCNYNEITIGCLICLILITFFAFVLLFLLSNDFEDSFEYFSKYILSLLIAGFLTTIGHVLINEYYILFLTELILVATNDIMAYLCGSFFGKHKMIALSPSKTWEGYIGALVSTVAISFFIYEAFCKLYDIKENYEFAIIFEAIWIGIVGPLGGLFGSLAKRASGIKDFGHIIPGHGGFVDRWDCEILTFSISLLVGRVFIAE